MAGTTEIKNPLDMVGGFEAYQDQLYSAFLKSAKSMKVEEILEFDEMLMKCDHSRKQDGLNEGVLGLLRFKKYLTSKNLQMLESGFNFYRSTLFREQLEPYLTSPNPAGTSVPSLTIEEDGLHRRTGEYIGLIEALSEASDDIIFRGKRK